MIGLLADVGSISFFDLGGSGQGVGLSGPVGLSNSGGGDTVGLGGGIGLDYSAGSGGAVGLNGGVGLFA
jgi:hypothetical protein